MRDEYEQDEEHRQTHDEDAKMMDTAFESRGGWSLTSDLAICPNWVCEPVATDQHRRRAADHRTAVEKNIAGVADHLARFNLCPLFDRIRLAGQRGLVHLRSIRLQHDAIGRNEVAGHDGDDIAWNQLFDGISCCLPSRRASTRKAMECFRASAVASARRS